MPTNTLWIEHTERAAWESVQALREKLSDAEKRMQRLAPPIEGWKDLVDVLDATCIPALPADSSYADRLRSLIERLAESEARLRARDDLRARDEESSNLLKASAFQDPAAARGRRSVEIRFDPADEEDDDFEPADPSGQRFLHALARRERELARELPSGISALLSAIESKVDELSDADELGLSDAALELGVLAMSLDRAARRAARDD